MALQFGNLLLLLEINEFYMGIHVEIKVHVRSLALSLPLTHSHALYVPSWNFLSKNLLPTWICGLSLIGGFRQAEIM